MIRMVLPALMVGSLLTPISPVDAAVLATGKVSNGLLAKDFYEIRINQIQLPIDQLREVSKHQKCKDAGAAKPN